jgi:AcrR family transcriptional regulator
MARNRRNRPSLQSANVQPDSPNLDDRQGIIDAAYGCLFEPHSGPIPVAAILERAGLSTRAFYRHFASKDELFLAMLQQEADALADRLDRIAGELPGDPVKQLTAWVEMMFVLASDPELRMHLTVIDSDEVRAAKGYRDMRERLHANRERSLERVLERGRDDGSFPLAQPKTDAVAISAIVSRELTISGPGSDEDLIRARARVLDFALRALGANRSR